MSDSYAQLLPILERHLSPINARAFLDKAMRGARLTQRDALDRGQVDALIGRLLPPLRLFLGDSAAEAVVKELGGVRSGAGSAEKLLPAHVEIQREPDILTARHRAREQFGGACSSNFALMRVLTVVSELARNIVNYSHGGWIDLEHTHGGLTVIARDTGPGIANLDAILGGRYRSRTGLGLGIIGVRRLSQRFDIATGPSGTRVEVTVAP